MSPYEKRMVGLTGVIAAITAVYASFAALQWCAIRQSVEQEVLSNRPIVIANGIEAVERTQDNVPSKVKVKLKNLGKSLAVDIVNVGQILIRPPGDPTPIDPDCDENGKLPKVATVDKTAALAQNEFIEPEWGPALGEQLSRAKMGKVVYVVGCAYYFGLDRQKRYFSDICVTWAPQAPQDFQSCGDANRNYTH
ncbi:MAG: hypothetical protein WA005_03740 [Candidatus Binataceae bacterium]